MKCFFKLFLVFFLVIGCSPDNEPVRRNSSVGPGADDKGDPTDENSDPNWLIELNRVLDGGPGKDGIPALTDPEFVVVGSDALAYSGQASYIDNDDLVLVYKRDGEIKAYPHKILDWHEIVNDQIGSDFIAVTYCPLTGTGIGWGRNLRNQITTFGVSGLLYETNLMPYDRLTDSYWNQMYNQCVTGELIEEIPSFFNAVQMSYGTLKKYYPEAKVLTTDTGYERDYLEYPYGNYLTNVGTYFPVETLDTRIHPKEIVRGVVVGDKSVAFRFPDSGRKLEIEVLNNIEIIVVSDKENNFIVSFLNKRNGLVGFNWTLVEDGNSPVILIDETGSEWNQFGEAISGPLVGEKLEVPYSYMGYWFAWANFYNEIKLEL